MLEIDLDGFLLSTEFIATLATFFAAIVNALVQSLLGLGSGS